MITFLRGDIMKCDAQALVVPVNCVGVAGAGLALAAKKRYPDWYKVYRETCDKKMLALGTVAAYRREHLSIGPPDPEYIISFPTKDDWRKPSNYESIAAGLGNLGSLVPTLIIATLAMPALGCGRGGLEWKQVKGLIQFFADALTNCNVICYEPQENEPG